MAVPIITSHSDFTLYTSQLQRLDVEVDTEQVELKIFHQARIYYSGDGRTEIFSSTYFARNGQLNIYDISSIIESYMQQYAMSVQQFILRLTAISERNESLEQDTVLVYCKQRLLDPIAKTLLDDFFLTTHTNRLVPTNAQIQLPFYNPRRRSFL